MHNRGKQVHTHYTHLPRWTTFINNSIMQTHIQPIIKWTMTKTYTHTQNADWMNAPDTTIPVFLTFFTLVCDNSNKYSTPFYHRNHSQCASDTQQQCQCTVLHDVNGWRNVETNWKISTYETMKREDEMREGEQREIRTIYWEREKRGRERWRILSYLLRLQ